MRRPFAPTPGPTFPVARVPLICVFLAAWLLRGDMLARSDELDPVTISDIIRAGRRLGEAETDQDWLHLVQQVHRAREAIEHSVPHVPYVLRNLADGTRRRQPAARPSTHADPRFVGKGLPAPAPRFIGQSVFLVNGDLRGGETRDGRQPLDDQRPVWNGNVVQSILVTDGSIEMQGYIVNSIVIARGKLDIKKGYIAESLVIVTAPGENDAQPGAAASHVGSIHLEKGFVARSIVVGDVASAKYISHSRIFGQVSDATRRYPQTVVAVPDGFAEILR